MRIKDHPILEFKHGKKVKFTYEGKILEGFEGEPIAAALHDNGIKVYRKSLRHDRARGFFCAIGHCSSCFMVVDGRPNTMTCITPLKEGMTVEKQIGKGELK
ncbi:MAG: (2Fe-2S)-binding protein [Candidatus Zixiibacteriota bacterium]